MGYGNFYLFSIIEHCSTVVSNDVGPGFFLGIWFLRYQPSPSVLFVWFFRKQVNAHVVMKNLMVIQLPDKMQTVHGSFRENGILVFNRPARVHTPTPLQLRPMIARFVWFAHNFSCFLQLTSSISYISIL